MRLKSLIRGLFEQTSSGDRVNKQNSFSKRKFFFQFLRVAFAVCLAILISSFNVDPFESVFYDLRYQLKPPTETSGKIELIISDLNSVQAMGSLPKFSDYKKALENIMAQNPKEVWFVTDLSEIEDTYQNKKTFADAVAKFPNVLQASEAVERMGQSGPIALPAPLEKIPMGLAGTTADRRVLAKDGVTRRQMLEYQNEAMQHVRTAALFNSDVLDVKKIRGSFELYEAIQSFTDFHRKGAFPTSRLEDVISGLAESNRFSGKIVLIGEDYLKWGKSDRPAYASVPFDHSAIAMTITELHANIIDTLIRNSSPIKADPRLNLFFTILISVLTVYVVLAIKPVRGIVILIGAAVGFLLFCYVMFWPFGVLIGVTHPLLAIFLSYYFFIPYRLIIENRRSWEYYQKHKLLSEVETLKTNFIGMMSHDLKTPLARIQGMTEVIARNDTALASPQREALDTIKQSAEDLLKFISTILNYAQIESHGVQLHYQSKDINELIQEVAKKHQFLAKLRHIEIITELEPLFSIRLDPELIKQVLSNLIENAIKYSPDHTKVLVTSEEQDGKVIIQVSDQGVGISPDELPNIFMKFFRSSGAKASPIKGSGLGLYLAQYFVGLHGGRISVESSPGQGSTFTVELPISDS